MLGVRTARLLAGGVLAAALLVPAAPAHAATDYVVDDAASCRAFVAAIGATTIEAQLPSVCYVLGGTGLPAGDTLTLQGGTLFRPQSGTFVNRGTIVVDSRLSGARGGLYIATPFQNDGTVRVTPNGQSQNYAAVTNNGIIEVETGGQWFNGGGITLTCPGRVTGAIGGDAVNDVCVPTATPTQSPAANPAGWNRSDVTVTWNWTDATGGGGLVAASCPARSVSTGEGASLVLTASCTNAGGHGGTASRTLKVDKTAPTLQVTGPAAGATYRSDVVPAASCTATDATSGVDASGCVVSGFSTAVGAHTVTFTATDVAGNVATVSRAYTVTPADDTAPVVTPQVSGPAGANGWYTGAATVTWSVADPESAITSPACPDATVSADTTGQTLTCTATSAGGTTDGTVTVRVDATAPSITVTGGPADTGSYGYGSVPAAPTCSASDATSGVDVAGCVVTGYSTEVGSHTITFTATDVAGNAATKTVTYTVAVVAPGAPGAVTAIPGDRSAQVSWTAPSFTGGSPVTGYTVTATPGSGAPVTATVEATATSATLTGLSGGVPYTVGVVATNSAGSGPAGTTTVAPTAAASISGSAPATVVAGTGYSFAYTVGGFPAPTVSLASGSLPTGVTLSADGRLSGTPTAAGTSTFTVQAVNGVGATAVSATQTVTVTPAAAADVSVSGGNGQSATATQPFATPLSVAVKDAYGNPVPGQSVTFRVTSGSAAFQGSASATVTTNASGIATAPALVAGRAAGTVTVSAALTGTTSVPAATFTETVLATTAARANLSVTVTSPATAARGGTFTVTVKVTNAGPNAASSLIAGLDLGPGLTVTNSGGGTAGIGNGSVYWTAPGLSSGASLTYTVTVRAASRPFPYSSAMSAAAVSVVPDPVLANNVTTASIRLT